MRTLSFDIIQAPQQTVESVMNMFMAPSNNGNQDMLPRVWQTGQSSWLNLAMLPQWQRGISAREGREVSSNPKTQRQQQPNSAVSPPHSSASHRLCHPTLRHKSRTSSRGKDLCRFLRCLLSPHKCSFARNPLGRSEELEGATKRGEG